MIKTVSILLLVLLGVLLLMASRQPDAFAIERSVVVSAPAEVIYPKIADLHQWSAWSPYEKFDPQTRDMLATVQRRFGRRLDVVQGSYSTGKYSLRR